MHIYDTNHVLQLSFGIAPTNFEAHTMGDQLTHVVDA